MEISKLTICRQDVIVVSDTETQSMVVNSNRKKKLKRKTECVRNVKLTKMTVNRIVPLCYRQRCRNGQHYHRQTSKNTKYRKEIVVPTEIKYQESRPLTKNILYETDKNDSTMNIEINRDLYSPITVASSSDMYENISSCSFNILSSDSDELEDLIKLTRKRMKNDNESNSYPLRKSICTTTNQDDYQNISSNDEVFDSSIHSMDTVVLYNDDAITTSQLSSEELNLKQHNNNNNNIDPILLCKSPGHNINKLHQQKIPGFSAQNNKDNLSPLYEISGKVFMEHYLNTSII